MTPFTTQHEDLSRFARGVINTLTLFVIWNFSGITVHGIDNKAGAYIVGLIICFIVARLFTLFMDFMLKTRATRVLKYIGYALAAAFAVVLHLGVIMFTKDMGSEFSDWGVLVFLTFFVDLVIWELSSLFIQLYIGKKLASSPDSFAGTRKSMQKLMTPPLLKAFIDP